jgi:predicted helicase
LKGLELYYAAIRANAAQISSHAEKQTFLKLIYENFYKVYNPKAADRLGVVYTPHEIVKFMVEGADWLTQKHFSKALIDPHVEILDPATGTGTFICELLEHFRGQPQKLAHKYKNELHANEVAILPYYVANLNIEATYAAISGQFAEYPNLCFVDTLDNVAALGIRTGQHVGDLFGGISDENIERVKRQNARKISVIIGNPPYNAGQLNELAANKNRAYPNIDRLIHDTYVRLSNAQKTLLYDMYARFFRWASDRMHDDGVIAFVTNRSFIESRTFDGFRKAVEQDFNEIYVVDLGGDIRANPKLSGTKHNVFGIQTGVAISFMVKRHRQKGCKIFYARRPEFDTAEDKLAFLGASKLSSLVLEITPDDKGNWLNLTGNDWDDLIPIGPESKTSSSRARCIFLLGSPGIMSGRDDWIYDQSSTLLQHKIRYFLTEFSRISAPDTDASLIKLSETIRSKIGVSDQIDASKIVRSNFRPFVKKALFLSRLLIDRPGVAMEAFLCGNLTISYLGVASSNPLSVFATENAVDYGLLKSGNGGTQVTYRYRYTSSGERVDNITDWALRKFRDAYRLTPSGALVLRQAQHEGAGAAPIADDSAEAPPSALPGISPTRGEIGRAGKAQQITKDDIFHYVYGVLHDPVYREKYAINLKREFPRIPFYPDFRQWAAWGEKLMALHVGYEGVDPWPLTRIDTPDEKAREAGVAPKAMLKADKDNGTIRLDTETQLTGVPPEAWTYKLGNRSGLEWILDQYKEKTPKDPTIREKFNTYRFADYKEVVIDLLMRVTRVSVETVAITEAMKGAKR